MSDFYTFDTEAKALQCVAQINGSTAFPITGNRRGQPAPTKQKTLNWIAAPMEMISGRWAVPRIPTVRLDSVGVGNEERGSFLAAYGQNIMALTPLDFPTVEV